MSCKEYAWKIGPYVDGELPSGERNGVEAHIQRCEDCREMAMSFRALDRLAGGVEIPSVSGREWAAMLEAVTASAPAQPALRTRRSWEWLLPVASAAALLLLSLFIGKTFFEGQQRAGGDVPLAGQESGVSGRSPLADKPGPSLQELPEEEELQEESVVDPLRADSRNDPAGQGSDF